MATAALTAGNWREFGSFCWLTEPANADDFAVVYTRHRDSGLLDQSNAAVIARELAPYFGTGDCEPLRNSHWAVGWIDGYLIRPGSTAAEVYENLMEQIDDYPILDEADYSDRETEATFENINEAAWSLRRKYDLPADWQSDVYEWLSNNDDSQLENADDQGGCPSEESLIAAFTALGYKLSS